MLKKNEGLSKSGEILDFSVVDRIITKSGSWYTLSSEVAKELGLGNDGEESLKLGQGREKAKLFLEQNPEVSDKLEALVRSKRVTQPTNVLSVEADEEEIEEQDHDTIKTNE
eukprot:TRINITY_DN4070_c0_g1_i11.p1 TRINITY_DN4070_c0_g1~~TRINITY_DN4070_c0_g1_i11.p1  ORF type:complete len:112 (+),score=36.19 TRINITY_DN4070_c0_g1_i11:243-578(+)